MRMIRTWKEINESPSCLILSSLGFSNLERWSATGFLTLLLKIYRKAFLNHPYKVYTQLMAYLILDKSEGAFETIFCIIKEEGGLEGGVVVQRADAYKQHVDELCELGMEYLPRWQLIELTRVKSVDTELTRFGLWVHQTATLNVSNRCGVLIWAEARGKDEVELTDEESSDSDEEDEVAEIFRIETNDVLTKDIEGFKTYEDYKDDCIYEWNKDMPWVHEKPWTDDEDEDDESSNEGWKRWNVYENTNSDHEEREYEMKHKDEERCELFQNQKRPVCNIRRFKMIKYSFREDVAVKESEYDDLTSTSKDALPHIQRKSLR
ncbi:hypothetical protein Tco_1440667 [Tanacetum coccineum]